VFAVGVPHGFADSPEALWRHPLTRVQVFAVGVPHGFADSRVALCRHPLARVQVFAVGVPHGFADSPVALCRHPLRDSTAKKRTLCQHPLRDSTAKNVRAHTCVCCGWRLHRSIISPAIRLRRNKVIYKE